MSVEVNKDVFALALHRLELFTESLATWRCFASGELAGIRPNEVCFASRVVGHLQALADDAAMERMERDLADVVEAQHDASREIGTLNLWAEGED